MIPVTFLSSYEYCPRKLYLTEVLKLVVPPKEVLVKGSIRHEIYDHINKSEEMLVRSISSRDKETIFDKYKQKYSKITRQVIIKYKSRLQQVNLDLSETFRNTWPMILGECELRAKNIFRFILETNLLGDELWLNLVPKIKSEYRVESEVLKLKGIIDQIEVYQDKIVPFELKTGSTPREGAWPGHKIQIGAYLLLMSEVFNKDIEKGYVRYLDSHETREIIMNHFLKHEVTTLRDKVITLLSQDTPPDPVKNENKCRNCQLKSHCCS